MELAPLLTRPATASLRRMRSLLERAERALAVRTEVPHFLSVRLPSSGRRIRLEAPGVAGQAVALRGLAGYEGATLELWRRLSAKADLILDVGANVGIYSLVAGDANRSARVFAFEPFTEALELLRRNVASAGLERSITIVPRALSKSTGIAELVVRGISGATLEPELWRQSASLPRLTIATVTLDDWCSEVAVTASSNTLLKMDIETHEPAALAGAGKCLAAGPAVVCEVLSTYVEDELKPFFPPEQWEFWWIGPKGPTPRRRIAGDPSWEHPNYLFLRRGSPFRDVVDSCVAR